MANSAEVRDLPQRPDIVQQHSGAGLPDAAIEAPSIVSGDFFLAEMTGMLTGFALPWWQV